MDDEEDDDDILPRTWGGDADEGDATGEEQPNERERGAERWERETVEKEDERQELRTASRASSAGARAPLRPPRDLAEGERRGLGAGLRPSSVAASGTSMAPFHGMERPQSGSSSVAIGDEGSRARERDARRAREIDRALEEQRSGTANERRAAAGQDWEERMRRHREDFEKFDENRFERAGKRDPDGYLEGQLDWERGIDIYRERCETLEREIRR